MELVHKWQMYRLLIGKKYLNGQALVPEYFIKLKVRIEFLFIYYL